MHQAIFLEEPVSLMGRGCIAGCWRSLIWIPQVSPAKLCSSGCFEKCLSFCCCTFGNLKLSPVIKEGLTGCLGDDFNSLTTYLKESM